MPVILAGNEAQKKKYLGRLTEEPLMCVSVEFEKRRFTELTCLLKLNLVEEIDVIYFILVRPTASLNPGRVLTWPG